MWIPRFASAFRRRLRVDRWTPAALGAVAWNPSYRAPAEADTRAEMDFKPPGTNAPLEAWGANDLVIRDGSTIGCSLSGRAFIAMGARELTQVRLVAVQPFMDELARCPHLVRLRRLDLSGNRIGVNGAKALAGSHHLDGLKELVLSGNHLGDAGVDLLRAAPWFNNLAVLELADNGLQLEPDAPARVSKRPCWRVGLQELDLSNNPLDADIQLPIGLRRLSLSRCGLRAAFVAKLAAFTSLETLDLSFAELGPDGVGTMRHLPRLEQLNLGFNDIEDAGAEALADAGLASLESLDVAANRITEQGAAALADSHDFASLRVLNLTANPIGDTGALHLMRSEGLGSLNQLNVSNCGLTDAGVRSLAVSETLGGLQILSLAWNAIGDRGVRALAACPDLAGLRELDLTGTRLGFAGAAALAESPHLANLQTIRLGNTERLPADAVAVLRERYTIPE